MNDVEAISQSLLTRALAQGASDIHLNPRREDALVRFRIDDVMTDTEKISKRMSEKFISHFKFLAGMDIGEKRRPQNGALDLEVNRRFVNLRLSTLPTPYGESLVLRILPQEQTHTVTELSLFPQCIPQLISLMNLANGLIMITGPTGSGKSTLLYSLLNAAVFEYNRRVITFEEPVEIKNDLFVQMEVNDRAGMSYSEGFKSILRHDPDIIMIGEIRDAETAQLAVRAAMTGHLVLTTMHTRDTFGAVYRLQEFEVPLSYIEQTLTAVIAQRLVSLICPYCGSQCKPACRTRRKRRRLGVYEILSGESLHSWLDRSIETGGWINHPKIKTIEDFIKRGVACGFLHENSYSRWVGVRKEAFSEKVEKQR